MRHRHTGPDTHVAHLFLVGVLLGSLTFAPVGQVLAQEASTSTAAVAEETEVSPSDAVPAGPATTTAPVQQEVLLPGISNTATTTATTTPQVHTTVPQERASLATTTATSTPKVEEPTVKTKFKKSDYASQEAQLAAVRKHLLDQNVAPEILARLDAYEAGQEEVFGAGLLKKVTTFLTGDIETKKQEQEVATLAKKQPFAVESFEGAVATVDGASYEKLFPNQKEQGATLLQKVKNFIKNGATPTPDIEASKNAKPFAWLFGAKATAEASTNPDDYKAAGGEVVLSQAVRDKASALGGDPLSMLNFVRNNIDYVPYYGSKKGSDATLVERAGNDMDKASLLIAMLRASNIPARYRHVDAKMDIDTVTSLLGVETANAAAQVLSLHKIPYTLFTQNDEPVFFVVEHTYVEAYMPYGHSRGADLEDGGPSQWVPMDPTIMFYYYERPVDVMDEMRTAGFNVQTFFEDYLHGDYGAVEPLEAFKNKVQAHLTSNPPTYYPDLTYDEARMRAYPQNQNLSFMPGTLPYKIAADLDTYDYLPVSLRHTMTFKVVDDQNLPVLEHAVYVSDLANKELLITFDAATPTDQATIDSFETIYDVVPLSLVAVKTKIKANGVVVASSDTAAALGKSQTYSIDFTIPTRKIGAPITSIVAETLDDKKIIAGNTDAIALDTGRIIPSELRPAADTQTTSYVANQVLYSTATDYLHRLEQTEGELASIIGGDFTDVATRATIFNGIEVTYSNGQPYSFDWKGLRIDASSVVRYFNRFGDTITPHKKEFVALFGLQASQDESDIFEDNFGVESVATVKGLKLVSANTFAGVTLRKITQANNSDIDSLSVSAATKSTFHAAVDSGRTLYVPSAPVTYGDWKGLFYISIDFNKSVASYAIGEGLNGGYTVEQFSSGWQNFLIKTGSKLATLTANIITPTNGQTFSYGPGYIPWKAQYSAAFGGVPITTWEEKSSLAVYRFSAGNIKLRSGYGTTATVDVTIQKNTIGTPGAGGNNSMTFDDAITKYMNELGFPPGVLKAIVGQESGGEKFSTRYEPCVDINLHSDNKYTNTAANLPYTYYLIGGSAGLITGDGVKNFTQHKDNVEHLTPKQMIDKFSLPSYKSVNNSTPTVYEVWNANRTFYSSYCIVDPSEGNYPAQFLLATSYGKAQVLYREAVGVGFNKVPGTTNDFPIPKNPWYLFYADDNMKVAAKILKSKYDSAGNPPSPKGYVGNDCKVDPLNNMYFANTYGNNWTESLKSDYKNNTLLWQTITNTLSTDKDRLWWAVRFYNGGLPSTIHYANKVCGSYHVMNP